MLPRRLSRLTLGSAALVASVLLVGGAFAVRAAVREVRPAPSTRKSPEDRLRTIAGRLKADAPYRDPTSRERDTGAAAMRDLLDGRWDAALSGLTGLGFTATRDSDPTSGRPLLMLTGDEHGDRAWGVVLVDLSAPVRLGIEVPHPNSDMETERVGGQLFSRLPGSILLMAGAHRQAGHDKADVAHNDRSMFSAMADQLADRGIPQLQIHGFATRALPDADVIVSTGAAPGSDAAHRLADSLEDAGLRVCRAWQQSCGQLEGTTNVQGRYAAGRGAVFLHLETSWRVRGDAQRRLALVAAIAKAQAGH